MCEEGGGGGGVCVLCVRALFEVLLFLSFAFFMTDGRTDGRTHTHTHTHSSIHAVPGGKEDEKETSSAGGCTELIDSRC